MYKIAIGLFVVAHLHAQSYEDLLGQAINNSVKLQLIQKQQEQISLNGQIERRYENPNLELEIADFSSQFVTKSNSFGARIGISQSIPLPHIQKDREFIIQNQINVVQKQYSVEKSNFIYGFNLKYLAYKKAQNLLALHEKSIMLSKEILETVNQRYQEGAVAKSDYLEAKLEYSRTQNRRANLLFDVSKTKNELLAFSNITNAEFIESGHLFLLAQQTLLHSTIELGKAKNQVSQAKLELLQHSIESIEFFSELEKEPDQDIFRVGVSIALPTFNVKSEERQLEKIKIANQALRMVNQERLLLLEIEQLKSENSQLEQLKQRNQSLISSQEELFNMYQQSYRIAKVNLLKLQQIKEQRIINQEKILESNFAIEQNNIKINYLQGAYSE
jgi:cobalt-zinc-cadmium efflux system outer membrane protein